MFTWTISSVLWDSAIDASCVHCTRLCVWEREWMRECFIGAQTFLLALQNQNKKTHCTNATFLGLLTACKFLQTQTSFSSVRKISLCIIVSCYEWVCGRERERERERDHSREMGLCLSSAGFWWSWYVRLCRAREVRLDNTNELPVWEILAENVLKLGKESDI